jgi:trk system potassium uptake protein TrkA
LAKRSGAGPDTVAVIGLGRFGGQVARALAKLGHDVLGIDTDMHVVDRWADELAHVVQADATDEAALRQLGVENLHKAIVGIGDDLEASVLATLALVELGIREIWAKAITEKHGRILSAVGAHQVIYPEAAMGDRVAHLITSRLIDFIEFEDGFAIAKTRTPAAAADRTLAEAALRTRYGITVVGVKRTGEDFTYARPETVVRRGDLLIVAGRTDLIERFAAET